MKQTKRMLTSTLLFSSCFYYANYSQRVTCTHTQFLTCKFVFTESWFTSLSLCSNTLSNFQDSSTELLPVISIHTLQVSPLFLHNQLKKFSNSEQIYLLPWNYLCPKERARMLSLPSQVLPPHQGTSALWCSPCHSGCSPLCNRHVMERNTFSRFITSLNCSWEQSSAGLPAAIKGNAPSTATREENPRFPSSLSQCNKSRVT